MKAQFKLVYNSDGTYESHFGGRVLNGTYELSDDCQRLTARDTSGFTQNYRIIKLEENKLEFEAQLPSEKVIFIMKPEKE